MTVDLGPVYTSGNTFRARAEARQREYRAQRLHIGCGRYGHLLAGEDAARGANFLHPEAFRAARERQAAGKGVADRTFENMLSSQAMCFNIFAPLRSRPEFAASIMRRFVPGLATVSAIQFEHTPDREVFNDQTGRGGVDCDLLIEGSLDHGRPMVLVVETKFVEPEFSTCGFRKPGRAKKHQEVCSEQVPVQGDRNHCLYLRNKAYRYWQRSDEFQVLAEGAIPGLGCPFGGPYWQLWVNLTLAHAEASQRGAKPLFAVCAPADNDALLRGSSVLDGFRHLVREPQSVLFLGVNELLGVIDAEVPVELSGWADGLMTRYGQI